MQYLRGQKSPYFAQVRDASGERRSGRFRTKSAALEFEKRIIDERQAVRRGGEAPTQSDLFLSEVREFLLELEPETKPSTFGPLEGHMSYWVKIFGKAHADVITTAKIKTKLEELKKERKLSNATRNRYRYSLYAFYEWLRRNKRIRVNPVLDVLVLEETQVRPSGCWDEEEHAEKYITEAYKLGLKWGALATLRVFQGPRASEIVALKVKDFLFEKETLAIRRIITWKWEYIPNTNERRKVPHVVERTKTYRKGGGYETLLFPRVAAAIRALIDEEELGPEDFVFQHHDGKPYGTNRLKEIHYLCVKNAGVPFVRPHGTRHFVATHVESLAEGRRELSQALLGHKHASTTQKYVHLKDASHLAEQFKEIGWGKEPGKVLKLRGKG